MGMGLLVFPEVDNGSYSRRAQMGVEPENPNILRSNVIFDAQVDHQL